jgi:hypothetical protein
MIKKISIILAIIIVLFLGFATSVPFLFKDKIIVKVKTVINENLNAKVNFKDVDITIISSFPDLGLKLQDLTVIGIDSFANDTLANIKNLQLNLNLMSVIKGKSYDINSVIAETPSIYAKVLKSGKANWDITKPDTSFTSTDTSTTAFKGSLKKYTISNGKVIYDDAYLGFFMDLTNLNHEGKGDFTQDVFTLTTNSDIDKLTVKYGGIPYLNQVKLKAELPIEIDMKQMKFTLGENKIQLNDLLLSFVGNLIMPNDTDMVMDFKFDAQKSDLKNFLSLIPAMYSNNFKDLNASGKFGLDGKVNGTYNEQSLPAFDINLLIENGTVKYSSLPAGINNIQVKAHINNPDGVIDHTVINIPAFHLAFDKAPIDGRLLVKTPTSDPYLDIAIKGKLDVRQLTTIFPMEGMTLSGIIDADVQAMGNKSAIDKEQYENFKASGQMLASNFNYSGSGVDKPVHIPSAKMNFSPRNITLENLKAKVGKSDFQANGTINNYLAYIFKKDQPLKGTFNLQSDLMDINELMGPSETETTTKDTSKLTVIEVPKNIDFNMSVKADRILYDNYDIKNARGSLLVKDQTIHFKDMALEMLDGTLKMNGSYATTDIKKPKIDIDFGIEKMNIQKAFSAFNTIKLLAPIAQHTKGTFSTNLKFDSDLDQNMMPVYSSINATGITNIIQAVLDGFEPLNKLAATLNTQSVKTLELNNVLTKFKIDKGRLNVSPFNIKKGDILMNVEGSNGLDQTMDYNLAIQIPRAMLGGATNETANSLLASLNSKAGTSIALSETVKVNAVLGGTILKPTIKLNLADGDAKAETKAIANQIISDKKEALETKAKEEVNKITTKATEQIQQKTDTLKKQAEQKATEEIKNKLNNLFKKKE